MQHALDQLTDIWLQAYASLRQAITAASAQIDQQLSTDPHHAGESRPNGRVYFLAPLGVNFRFEPDGNTVTVFRVWLFRPRAAH